MSLPEPRVVEPIRGRRRGRAWINVAYGLHRPAVASPTGDEVFRSELAAWQLLAPATGWFTHLTAARLRGWWLPPVPADLPVFLAMGRSDVRPARAGVVTSRHPRPVAFDLVAGLRCATPAEILLACARNLGLIDLVVLLDAALHAGDVTLDELAAGLTPRRRGAPMVRRAKDLADARSESAWETLLRLLHVVCGLEVEPQHEVLDEGGGLVARGDLWLVGTHMLHEYDGSDHLERAQQRSDLRRLRRLDGTSWGRRGYTSDDVVGRPIGILRDADRSVGRIHDPERIRAGYDLLRASLFTPAGTTLFRQRLGLPAAAPDRKWRRTTS